MTPLRATVYPSRKATYGRLLSGAIAVAAALVIGVPDLLAGKISVLELLFRDFPVGVFGVLFLGAGLYVFLVGYGRVSCPFCGHVNSPMQKALNVRCGKCKQLIVLTWA